MSTACTSLTQRAPAGDRWSSAAPVRPGRGGRWQRGGLEEGSGGQGLPAWWRPGLPTLQPCPLCPMPTVNPFLLGTG